MSPRGNDSDAAGRELEARLGSEANAEEMIQANAERWSPELRAAQRKSVDEDATEELGEDGAAKLVDGELLAYAVRGDHVITVSEDEDGFVHKEAHELEGEKSSKASSKASEKTSEKAAEKAEK